jgi:energy-coupling factor transport system ATP-binding protein
MSSHGQSPNCCHRPQLSLPLAVRTGTQKVSFSVNPGEVLLIAGSSGCGKTTLMRCINGLIPNAYQGDVEGDITLFGQSVFDMEMAEISQTVGTILQDPERQILGTYVLNDVAFGLESLGMPRDQILSRVDQALDRMGILHLRDRETFGTSGGEKQKIALAGVLAMKPRILLLDEPLASLDPASAHEALQIFRQLADEGLTVMIVEHRVEDVLAISPRAGDLHGRRQDHLHRRS